MTKKLIRLTESDLHKIVNESVKRVLKEGQEFPIDPSDLARELFNNGVDFNLFVHRLEKTYEMLQADNQSQNSDPLMALVQTIKNSSDFDDDSGNFNEYRFVEGGDAAFNGIIDGIKLYRLGYHLRKDGVPEFFGWSDEDGEYYEFDIKPEQAQEIIRLIR
jgi:hypothetical protein